MKFIVALLCLFGATIAYPHNNHPDPKFISELHGINFNAGSNSPTSPEWHYSGLLGPDNWYIMFPTCGGVNQSPIDIESKSTVETFYSPFKFTNFDVQPPSATVANNGHTVALVISEESGTATVEGGELPDGKFTYLNMHYHWGSTANQGSEHTVNGVQYPLEQHMVFWNTKYATSSEAMQNPDGLAVLGTLYEISELDNPSLEPIVTALGSIREADTSTTVPSPSFSLSDILPSHTNDYYRYSGSLTTTTCLEAVTWTVFVNRLTISERQLEEFRLLLDHSLEPLENNFRPVQPLNSRVVNLND